MSNNNLNIIIINGPNLNLIGKREVLVYGHTDIDQFNGKLIEIASSHNIKLEIFQSNSEDKIINKIQDLPKLNCKYIIANLAAYTHTSIAIRDALIAINIPIIEVHISNVFKREKFRHNSYISDIADGIIIGFGLDSYKIALNQSIQEIKKETKNGY
jgi:3-dehydroquinate dehydratase-2